MSTISFAKGYNPLKIKNIALNDIPCKGVQSPKDKYHTKRHLVVRFQFWSSSECGVYLRVLLADQGVVRLL